MIVWKCFVPQFRTASRITYYSLKKSRQNYTVTHRKLISFNFTHRWTFCLYFTHKTPYLFEFTHKRALLNWSTHNWAKKASIHPYMKLSQKRSNIRAVKILSLRPLLLQKPIMNRDMSSGRYAAMQTNPGARAMLSCFSNDADVKVYFQIHFWQMVNQMLLWCLQLLICLIDVALITS